MDPIILDSMLRVPVSRLTTHQYSETRKLLELKTPVYSAAEGVFDTALVRAYYEDEHYIHIPRQWPGALRLMAKNQYEDRRSSGHPIDLSFRKSWRPGQQDFVRGLVDGVRANDLGGIGKAGCGFGKTVSACGTLAALGRTTLVLVHKEFLRDQWAKEVKNFLGVDVGYVQGDQLDYEGRPVVVGMIQTLAQREFPQDFYRYFGLVLADECHRMAAPTFWQTITKFPARYYLGLTATPRRRDRLEKLFFWTIGKILAEGHGESLDCKVWKVLYQPNLHPRDYSYRGNEMLARLINKLCEDQARTDMICRIIHRAVKKGRKVLVLTDRVAHVEEMVLDMRRRFEQHGENYTAGNYKSGKTKKAQASRDTAAKATVCVGTWHMAQEGLDIPDLDTVVLATPRSDIEQGIGRVRRLLTGKREPVVIDITDQVPLLRGMNRRRNDYYAQDNPPEKSPWPVQVVRSKSMTA